MAIATEEPAKLLELFWLPGLPNRWSARIDIRFDAGRLNLPNFAEECKERISDDSDSRPSVVTLSFEEVNSTPSTSSMEITLSELWDGNYFFRKIIPAMPASSRH